MRRFRRHDHTWRHYWRRLGGRAGNALGYSRNRLPLKSYVKNYRRQAVKGGDDAMKTKALLSKNPVVVERPSEANRRDQRRYQYH